MNEAADPPPAVHPRWERVTLGSGIVFGVTQLIAVLFSMLVVVPTHAPIGAPAAETAAALARHADLVAAGTYLFTIPLPFLLLFLGGLFAVLRRALSGGEAVAAAALAAGVAAAVIGPFGAVLSGLGAPLARLGGDPAVIAEIDSITPLAMALAAFPQATLLVTVSAVALQGPLAPRWLAWTGLVLAALGLIATGTIAVRALFPAVILEMVLFPLWTVALSVSLLRGPRAAAGAAPSL
jgi:hypothetical protein